MPYLWRYRKEIKNPCTSCKGRGYKRVDKEIEIKIPAGIQDGTTMRLSGMGDIGKNGGPRGDIYLTVRVREHSKFRRENSDIFSTLKLGLAEAALGYEVTVPTIHGSEKLKIKSGTQSGQIYTLKDTGMPLLNRKNTRGNHYVEVEVVIPSNLSREEKKAFRRVSKITAGTRHRSLRVFGTSFCFVPVVQLDRISVSEAEGLGVRVPPGTPFYILV